MIGAIFPLPFGIENCVQTPLVAKLSRDAPIDGFHGRGIFFALVGPKTRKKIARLARGPAGIGELTFGEIVSPRIRDHILDEAPNLVFWQLTRDEPHL